MGRKQVYANAAERQKAYRARMTAPEREPDFKTRQRALTRPARLAAIQAAVGALHQEYEQWRDRLPDFQEGSEQEAKLTETVDLLGQAMELLADIDPPKGFGRD